MLILANTKMRGEARERSEEADAEAACCGGPSRVSDTVVETDVELLSVLSNETRYRSLRLIAEAGEDEICVCTLEADLDVSQSAVSQALSRLRQAGLVTRRKEGRWRYYGTTDRAERLLNALDDVRSSIDE